MFTYLYKDLVLYILYIKVATMIQPPKKKATENDTNGKRHETENSMKRKAKNGITKF